MSIEDCKHSVDWDYLGWHSIGDNQHLQEAWNKSIITKINDISIRIHKSSIRRGADTVIMNPKLIGFLPEYYRDGNKLLNRYNVEFDEFMDLDIIFVCNRTDNTIPQMVLKSVSVGNEIPEIMILHERQCTPEEVLEYKRGLCGYVRIQNYYSNNMKPRKKVKKLKL